MTYADGKGPRPKGVWTDGQDYWLMTHIEGDCFGYGEWWPRLLTDGSWVGQRDVGCGEWWSWLLTVDICVGREMWTLMTRDYWLLTYVEGEGVDTYGHRLLTISLSSVENGVDINTRRLLTVDLGIGRIVWILMTCHYWLWQMDRERNVDTDDKVQLTIVY